MSIGALSTRAHGSVIRRHLYVDSTTILIVDSTGWWKKYVRRYVKQGKTMSTDRHRHVKQGKTWVKGQGCRAESWRLKLRIILTSYFYYCSLVSVMAEYQGNVAVCQGLGLNEPSPDIFGWLGSNVKIYVATSTRTRIWKYEKYLRDLRLNRCIFIINTVNNQLTETKRNKRSILIDQTSGPQRQNVWGTSLPTCVNVIHLHPAPTLSSAAAAAAAAAEQAEESRRSAALVPAGMGNSAKALRGREEEANIAIMRVRRHAPANFEESL